MQRTYHQLKDFANEKFENLISYFDLRFCAFLRIFSDGRYIILTNYPDAYDTLIPLEHSILAPVPQQHIQSKFTYYFDQHTIGYENTMRDVKSLFGIDFGIDFIDIQAEHLDLIFFGGHESNHNLRYASLNHQQLFFDFLKQLSKEINQKKFDSKVIIQPGLHKIANLSDFFEVNKNKIKSNKRLHKMSFNHNEISRNLLTKQESNILHHLMQGKTCKMIAQDFHLSVRTIEMHVNGIKNKFNCRYKTEIIDIALKHQWYSLEANEQHQQTTS